ncbi:MAG: A24 family peptidase [Candidatus Gastranaerophilales bacterium]|nr:A24 family peptidase [Candidatus Gastranaerophilales bacterium]
MAVLCFLLLLACCFDYIRQKIPNLLLLGILAAGLVDAFRGGGMGIPIFIARSLAVIAAFYPFFRIGTIGAGDIKLLGICAGYFSGGRILSFLFVSMLVSAIFSLIKLCREKNIRQRLLYLGEYVTDVVRTGNLRLYFEDKRELKAAGICLSGPVLISALMSWGGVY